jgi:hypothetical protein
MPAEDAWGFPSGWYGAGATALGGAADIWAFIRAEPLTAAELARSAGWRDSAPLEPEKV